MALHFIKASASNGNPPTKKKQGHVEPEPLEISLDQPGRVRIKHWLAFLGIRHPTFYTKRWQSLMPPPDGHDPRPYWRTETVKAFLAIDHHLQPPPKRKKTRSSSSNEAAIGLSDLLATFPHLREQYGTSAE